MTAVAPEPEAHDIERGPDSAPPVEVEGTPEFDVPGDDDLAARHVPEARHHPFSVPVEDEHIETGGSADGGEGASVVSSTFATGSESVQSGALGPADLDPKLVIDLCSMPEEQALVCVERFLNSNLFGIRNKNGFLVGVIKRFKEEMGPNNTRGPVPHTSATVAGYGDHARTIHVGKLDGTVTSEVLAHIFGLSLIHI